MRESTRCNVRCKHQQVHTSSATSVAAGRGAHHTRGRPRSATLRVLSRALALRGVSNTLGKATQPRSTRAKRARALTHQLCVERQTSPCVHRRGQSDRLDTTAIMHPHGVYLPVQRAPTLRLYVVSCRSPPDHLPRGRSRRSPTPSRPSRCPCW